jgi:predicted ABC-type ATPase
MICIAGPNGAGKSTAAPTVLRDALEVSAFLNADTIASGLSPFEPETVAITAGKVLLRQFDALTAASADFAFETTLASRSFAPKISALAGKYDFQLIYLWLPTADAAVERVASRVLTGGHHIPEATIRRRYFAGIRNFFQIYRLLARTWQVYDNSARSLMPIARGTAETSISVFNQDLWTAFQDGANHDRS